MVNREVLQKRIEKVKEYLDFLKNIHKKYTLKEFKEDPMIHGSSERFLHLCIEALLDIGNHIIADENLGKVDVYSDVPEILHKTGYITKAQKDMFVKMIGFRNILVHDYLEVEREIVYGILQNNLDDIEQILKEIAKEL